MVSAKPCLVLVGTYTDGGGDGIHSCRMDRETGALDPIGVTGGIDNPSFLASDPEGRRVYAVQETGDSGAVFAYELDHATGGLRFLNQQPSHGAAPCHLAVDRTGKVVLVANYGSGSVCVLPIVEGGRLEPASEVVQHSGAGVDPNRQEGPHAHSVTVDPANRLVLVADLGLDRMMVYRLDATRGKLVPNATPWVSVAPGAGPRHFAFHPSGGYGYVVNELDSTITAFTYDASEGILVELHTVPALPEGFEGTSYCADIHLAPSGRYLYASNRGDDSVVIYHVDPATGRLGYTGHQSTEGRTPRNFAIDPRGRFLLAANQDSDTIVPFRIDEATGDLVPTGHVASVPAPVCVLFLTGME